MLPIYFFWGGGGLTSELKRGAEETLLLVNLYVSKNVFVGGRGGGAKASPPSLLLIEGKTAKASHMLLPLGTDWVDSILPELIL